MACRPQPAKRYQNKIKGRTPSAASAPLISQKMSDNYTYLFLFVLKGDQYDRPKSLRVTYMRDLNP